MGTALERATEILALTVKAAEGNGVPLPESRYVQMGDPIVACPVVIVSVSGIGPYLDLTGRLGLEKCGPPQTATLRITIAREYSCQNDDGTDDPYAIMQASVIMQADADVMWDVIYGVETYLGPSQVNIDSQISGGLVAVSGVFTIGIL
jgi:hypothetical protein